MSGQTWSPWIPAPEPCLGSGSRADGARPALAGRPPRRAQEAVGSQSTRSRAPGSWAAGITALREEQPWPGTCGPRARPLVSLGQPWVTV